jgi:hypothetical protein
VKAWLVGAVLALSSVALHAPRQTPRLPSTQAETARIRAHFDSVLVELRTRSDARWSVAQRIARARVVDELQAYRDRGLFPRNRDFPGVAVPYFIDRETGVRCAVGHLMEQTGGGALTTRIAARDNNVWIAELAGDAAVVHWLERNGLTLAEAARIQLPYVADDSPVTQLFGTTERAYAVGTAAVTVPTALLSAWNARGNADGHRRVGRVLGLSSSALSLAYGLMAATDGNAPAYAAPSALASAAIGTWFAARSQRRHDIVVAERRARVAQLHVAPLVPTRSTGTGVQLAFRF